MKSSIPLLTCDCVHAGELYIRHQDAQKAFQLAGDQDDAVASQTESNFLAQLTVNCQLFLEPLNKGAAAAAATCGTEKSSSSIGEAHDILKLAPGLTRGHTFQVETVKPPRRIRSRLTCRAGDFAEARVWIDTIEALMSTKRRQPTVYCYPPFCFPLLWVTIQEASRKSCLAAAGIGSDRELLFQARVFHQAVILQPYSSSNSGGSRQLLCHMLPLDSIKTPSVSRKKSTNTDQPRADIVSLSCDGQVYSLEAFDRLHHVILVGLLHLWSTLRRPSNLRTSCAQTVFLKKSLATPLRVGTTATDASLGYAYCMPTTSRLLTVEGGDGQTSQFSVLRIEKTSPPYLRPSTDCLLVQARDPDAGNSTIHNLYLQLSSRKVAMDWLRYFNIPVTVLLGQVHIIVNQLERLHLCRTAVLSSPAEPSELDPQEALSMLHLPLEKLEDALRIAAQWPEPRLLGLLQAALRFSLDPIISQKLTAHMTNAMLRAQRNSSILCGRQISLWLTEPLDLLPPVHLCIVNRLALYLSLRVDSVGLWKPQLTKTRWFKAVAEGWLPLTPDLCHLNGQKSRQIVLGVCYFLTSYQYVLQTLISSQKTDNAYKIQL